MKRNHLKLVALMLILVLTLTGPSSIFSVDAEENVNILYGDVCQDGVINAHDVQLVLLRAALLIYSDEQMAMLDEADFTVADVSGDSRIDAVDAVQILKYSAKLIDEFPIEKINE